MVVVSVEDSEGSRCVDVIRRPDGAFCFKEFRRDPEDGGRWSVTADYSTATYASQEDTLCAARLVISWLGPVLDRRNSAYP